MLRLVGLLLAGAPVSTVEARVRRGVMDASSVRALVVA